MPFHLHLSEPPRPEPSSSFASDVAFTCATIGIGLALIGAAYWFVALR